MTLKAHKTDDLSVSTVPCDLFLSLRRSRGLICPEDQCRSAAVQSGRCRVSLQCLLQVLLLITFCCPRSAVAVIVPLLPQAARPEADTEFPGPTAQGQSDSEQLPVRWSNQRNITWKVEIPGHGLSSPAIADGTVWLTTADVEDASLHVLRLDAETGALLSNTIVFDHDQLWAIHRKNSHASPTPLLHENTCYVHFGSHGTAALHSDGNVLWTQRLLYYHHHGPASSPVLAGNTLILVCDGLDHSFYDDRVIPDAIAPQFVAGLDASNGDIRWISRREGRHSYATPLLIDVDGRRQLISPGGDRVIAYDPESGEELWWVRFEGYSLVPRPVFGQGLVFVCTGYDHPVLLAIRPNGSGDVTDTHVVWQSDRSVPLNPSPVIHDNQLYTISDAGVLTQYVATTGDVIWKKRIGGDFSASPLLHNDRLYLLSESGTTTITSTGERYRIFARNTVAGTTLASFGVSAQSLYLRTDTHLYRITESEAASDSAPDTTDTADLPDAGTSSTRLVPMVESDPKQDGGIRIIGDQRQRQPEP